jgi:hypothetical protein
LWNGFVNKLHGKTAMNRSRFLVPPMIALVMATVGCGPPRLAPEHLELTVKLRTAVSAQHNDWLEMTASLVDGRRAAGEMAQDEHQAFQKIIALAREGRWQEAEAACLKLQAAQKPTPQKREQMERLQALSRP